MSTTIRYTGSVSAKRKAALEDCQNWFGGKYKKVRQILQDEFQRSQPVMQQRAAIRRAVFTLSFAGVQGFPAWVLVFDVLRKGP